MKPFKQEIAEGIADNISKKLKYSFFIDLYPIVTKKGGLVTIMFPNVEIKKIKKWLGDIEMSDLYTNNIETLKSIYSRTNTISSLKTLYRAVDTLKSQQTPPDQNDSRMSDLELVISKIERVIKSKLNNDEKELFNQMSSLLDDISDNASKSIEGSIGASTSQPEEKPEPEESPKEEPTEKPEEKPEEKPKEKQAPKSVEKTTATQKTEPTDKKPADEESEESSAKKEEVQRRIKNIVREILKKSVTKR
jgi:hypothetical protein